MHNPNNNTEIYTLRLFFIRHGETYANKQGLVLGQSESSLTTKGQIHSQLTGRYLKSIVFWKYYCSDQERAMHTAEYILAESLSSKDDNGLLLELERDGRLKERAKGAREGRDKRLSKEEAVRLYRLEFGNEVNLPFEEDDTTVWERFEGWLQDLMRIRMNAKIDDDDMNREHSRSRERRTTTKNVLVVSHSGTIRIILNKLKEKVALSKEGGIRDECISLDAISSSMIIPNTSVSIIDVRFSRIDSWDTNFIKIMDQFHLEDE